MYTNHRISRCDGMVDVTDSKSVGLIPRVGSSPTTGTKNRQAPKVACRFLLLHYSLLHFSLNMNAEQDVLTGNGRTRVVFKTGIVQNFISYFRYIFATWRMNSGYL